MTETDLPTFDDEFLEKDLAEPTIKLSPSTETIDLENLLTRDVSTSGSFDITGDIWETTFGKLMQALPIPALLVDSSLRIYVANQACKRISRGYSGILNKGVGTLCPSRVVGESLVALATEVFRTRKPRVGECAISMGGTSIWARLTFRSIRVRDTRSLLLMIEDLSVEKRQLLLNQMHQDQLKKQIERRKAAQKAVQRAKEEWELTFDSVRDPIAILDSQHRIRRANRALIELIGSNSRRVIGSKCFRHFHGTDQPPPECPHVRLLQDGKEHSAEIHDRRLGKVFEVTVFPLRDKSNRIMGAVHVARDITDRTWMEQERDKLIVELSAAKEALEFQVAHDPLTSIWNRTAVLGQLTREVERARRETFSIGLIMIDLDDFKNINDTCGHLVGDAVLREVAHRLTTLIRPYDSVGRYGGEEFVVVLPRCNRDQARAMAERLRIAFANEPIKTVHGSYAVTLSCGVGIIDPRSNKSIERFIRAADDALYKAKRSGRNRVEEFA